MKTLSFHIQLYGFDSNIAEALQNEIARHIFERQIRAAVGIVEGAHLDSETRTPCQVVHINWDMQGKLEPVIQAVKDALAAFSALDVSVFINRLAQA